MYIGVDVGGTYTDAVLLEKNQIKASAKAPSGKNLLSSILEAIDKVLQGVDPGRLKRIVFSTTMITNLIAERKYDPVALLLIPGPGLSYTYYQFNTFTRILTGTIDYRGRETVSLKEREVEAALDEIADQGFKKVCVIGKFSPRNTSHEKRLAMLVKEKYPDWEVELGHLAGGQLNFPRRVVTTYLTAATRESFHHFLNLVRQSLAERQITAEALILKADGGTLPMENSDKIPVETIFSGPAASTLGALALTSPGETAVIADIGGTTTDLALILNGQPLLSAKGARIEGQLTQVRTLAVKSVPIGGDSVLERMGNEIIIHGKRMGPAYCMGGPVPTPTDALRVLGLTTLGDQNRAAEAMAILGERNGSRVIAEKILNLVVDGISSQINKMFQEWELEPAYRVWEILQKRKVRPSTVVGVGGGANGLVDRIAEKLGCRSIIPPYAAVANAVGAAVAKTTLQLSLRADTERGSYLLQEEGFEGKIDSKQFNEKQALDILRERLIRMAARHGLDVKPEQLEVTHQEVFNMVRDWQTKGRLIDITVQTPRGITGRIEAGGQEG
ncbi:Acetophenone carboxylase gamma subunit [Pelotomaculum schinkii]|uniref:Acetophenone carboxylase gamma subunit n=1 Tax=Pelotomaculum schinkii TaxID=78350 RepID=A0A4Y7RDK9_9FIRM|nr:hydantoinase/oxoprolinase family protein [Pelotomaculum schinkii]TEB06843.1 Acetophenone carboxylase gamma subunit [Pelotomaculum schinkii]